MSPGCGTVSDRAAGLTEGLPKRADHRPQTLQIHLRPRIALWHGQETMPQQWSDDCATPLVGRTAQQ